MSRSKNPTERVTGSGGTMMELQRNSTNWAKTVEEIVKMEKEIFAEYVCPDRSLEEELKKTNSGLLYIDLNEEVVGYVLYSYSPLSAAILELAVKESYRRQGHGEALLKGAIEKCRSGSIQRISLNVDSMNIAAMSLYKKFGFQIESSVKSYYSSDRDAYRMYLD